MDPERMDALLKIPIPETGDQLQQFLCAVNWMRMAISRYNELVSPLEAVLEENLTVAGSRTKRASANARLRDSSWNATNTKCFEAVKLALASSLTLAHPDLTKHLCLFTDVSDEHWGDIVTQIPAAGRHLAFAKERHEPLASLSGSFHGRSGRFSTPEKDDFAIVQSVKLLDYILLRPEGFQLFTDHKNLVYIFNPLATNPSL